MRIPLKDDLTSLLMHFRSWLDRIPFTVLLGISTSVELFEGRLPRSCVSLLQGKHFEVQDAGNCVDRIYEALQTDPSGKLWIGRNITSTLFERASDYFQTPEAFSRMVKVRKALSIYYMERQVSKILYSMRACHISLQTLFLPCLEALRNQRCSKADSQRLSGTCHHSECKQYLHGA